MHDAAQVVRRPVLVDQGEDVFPGIGGAVFFFGLRRGELRGSAVDDDGFAGFGGDVHLRGEGQLLGGDVGVFEVVVVEADLAYGDAFGVCGETGYLGEVGFGGVVGLLGVDACAGVYAGVVRAGGCVGEVERVVHEFGAFADTDGEDGFDVGCVGSAEDFVAVFVVEVEMGVGVDQMHS